METNNNKEEDILNSLLKTNYIDLSNVETNNLTQLNTDDILKEFCEMCLRGKAEPVGNLLHSVIRRF